SSSSAASDVYKRQGYVSLKKWWSVGFVISGIDITVMILVGLVWWKFLGFY
ncbi:anion permease, partial [Campylobacter jejuni]|uniref:anion permease n=1 Tax=Campylobacter jejuni TaxID=197 RepID=UPI000B03D00E